MTKSTVQTEAIEERETQPPAQKPEVSELDAEIVRDLDVNGVADDARGGCVRTLQGGCGYSGGGQV